MPQRPFRAVGPIENSQMDPTEGNREEGAQGPTVPWRPFRAFPHGHQDRAHQAFSNGPHRGKQVLKTHNGMCTGSHFQAYQDFAGFCRVANRKTWDVVKVYIVQRCVSAAVTLRQQNGKDEEETQRKQEALGNWDEEATEKRWRIPNAMQERG